MTFLDLIRKNKRQSALLMFIMIALGVVIGAVIGAAMSFYVGPSESSILLGASAVGAVVALIAAGGGAAWSFYSGSDALLRMAHAKPLAKEMDPELFNVVEEIAIAGGLPMPRIYVIGDSAMNAFATGRDPEHAAVAITVGLRQKLTRDELQGVMAHELAHVRHYDIRFSLLMATMVGLIAFATDAFLRTTWHIGASGRGARSRGKGGGSGAGIAFAIALILAVLAPIVAAIVQMAYSRQREYLADAGAVELTRNPKGLADALRKLAGDTDPLVDTANRGSAHMYIVNPLSKMRRNPRERASLMSSHPPLMERIARLEALMR
ncbi:MAG: M48 family metallopeptidase [Phycisphaeraceae bacterium]|nr:M48 family metallopeptidase [Phycisphaeraceae bacterium]